MLLVYRYGHVAANWLQVSEPECDIGEGGGGADPGALKESTRE